MNLTSALKDSELISRFVFVFLLGPDKMQKALKGLLGIQNKVDAVHVQKHGRKPGESGDAPVIDPLRYYGAQQQSLADLFIMASSANCRVLRSI